jgi:hypothetical protein
MSGGDERLNPGLAGGFARANPEDEGAEGGEVAREVSSVTLSRKQFADLVSYVARLRRELGEERESGARRLRIIGKLTIELEEARERAGKP